MTEADTPREDPRELDKADEGLPEENPDDVAASHEGPGRGPEQLIEDAPEADRAPKTHAGQDQPPSHATGNPHAQRKRRAMRRGRVRARSGRVRAPQSRVRGRPLIVKDDPPVHHAADLLSRAATAAIFPYHD